MTARSVLLVCALAAMTYAGVVFWMDYRHAQQYPVEQREPLTPAAPVTLGEITVRLIETPFMSTDDFVQSTVTLRIGDAFFSADEPVWIDTRADPENYTQRYLERFDVGYVVSANRRRVYVVETLQGDHALADEPRLNLWLADATGVVANAMAISVQQAQQAPEWRALFAGAHQARVRVVPAVAGLLTGLGLLLLASAAFWRAGSWGVVCALVHFLVPIIGGSPFLSGIGWGSVGPAIVMAFLLSAGSGALLAVRLKTRQTASLPLRMMAAMAVPAVTLLVGVVAVVTLYRIAHGDLTMARSSMAPALLLLRTGIGVALLLGLAGALYTWLMNRKLHHRGLVSGSQRGSPAG